MNLGIKGKTALVIGASRGIGRAVAIALAAEGCRVIAVARDRPSLESLAAECGCVFIAHDMMQFAAAEYVTGRIKEYAPPDIIYHAMGGSFDAIREWSRPASEWAQVWQFNLGVAHDINRAFIPGMIERRWGRVVHTSSDGVKNSCGNVPYTSSKGAVEAYVRDASKLFAKDNVIISAVAPGATDNGTGWLYRQPRDVQQAHFDKYIPAQRFASPAEIAGVVALLCSEQASYMAGSVVAVDGGSR